MGQIVSAVLLFERDDVDVLCRLSSRLNESLIYLDGTNLPHITVAQFEAPFDQTKSLWDETEGFGNLVSKVISAGVSFVPTPNNNETWVELQILKTQALQDLQDKILDTKFARNHQMIAGKNNQYRPHITIGLLKGYQSQAIDLSEFTDLFRREFTVRLAVGPNGENFTFSKEQFSL